jgi:PIN domain
MSKSKPTKAVATAPAAPAAKTSNVFLDTEVFDSLSLDFQNANLLRVIRLAASGKIKLFLTTVTEGEILSHIHEQAREAHSLLSQVANKAPSIRTARRGPLKKLFAEATEEAIRESMLAQYRGMKKVGGIKVLPISGVAPDDIFKAYFEQSAPFGSKDKKAEFPDAFALEGLGIWCKANEQTMYVVSNDGDLKRSCASGGPLEHVQNIRRLLELFNEADLVLSLKEGIDKQWKLLFEFLQPEFEAIELTTTDWMEIWNYEVKLKKISGVDMSVVETKDGKATVSIECQFWYSLWAEVDDADSWRYDSEDKEVHYMRRIRGKLDSMVTKTITVELTYNPEFPLKLELKSATIDDPVIEIDPAHIHEDEEDFYDFDDSEAP